MNAFTPDASRALPGPAWLAERRLAAAAQLDDLTWPTTDEEIWRYSRVDDLDLDRFRPVPPEQLGRPGDEPAPGGGPIAAEAGERSGLVVVRNGRVVHHSLDADLEAKGVRVCGLATCEREEVDGLLGACSDASPDAFTVLHDAFLAGGAVVKVPPGVVVEQPIVVLHWSEGDGLASFPHTLVVAGESAEVTVFDRFGSDGAHDRADSGHLVDAVVELVVGDGSNVRYVSVQEHGPHTWQIALQRAHVGRDATLRSSAVALGGYYARLRSESRLGGEGGESDLTAVYFGDGTQMLDFRTLQDHHAPRTRSDLLFKGAVEDHAHSVYSGLIRIRPGAQHASAFQTNRNLVLTEGAEAMSVPNLEIETDDVRCSHASAVGPIDDDQLYYLATRGVPPEEAERLIVLGFFDDVFERLPLPSLVTPLRRSVIEKIEHRDPIARASA
ncbi:MAG TPA: Fe-S cluster assembly protein SufD [Acidimicrobiia bacterium]|nr:Fe-S cluster assembly protein SufD [Acidimicrobiia bacterium]